MNKIKITATFFVICIYTASILSMNDHSENHKNTINYIETKSNFIIYYFPSDLDKLNEEIAHLEKNLDVNALTSPQELLNFVKSHRQKGNNAKNLLVYYTFLGNRDLLQNKDIDFAIREDLVNKYSEFYAECEKAYITNLKKIYKTVVSYEKNDSLTDDEKAKLITGILMGVRVITYGYCLRLLSTNKNLYLFFSTDVQADNFSDDRKFPLKKGKGNCDEFAQIIAYQYSEYLSYIDCDMFELVRHISHCFTVFSLDDEYFFIFDPYAYTIFIINRLQKNNHLPPINYHGNWFHFFIKKNNSADDGEFSKEYIGHYNPFPILGTRDNFISLLIKDTREKLHSITKSLDNMEQNDFRNFIDFFCRMRVPILENAITNIEKNVTFLDSKKKFASEILALEVEIAGKIVSSVDTESTVSEHTPPFQKLILLLYLANHENLTIDFNDNKIIIKGKKFHEFRFLIFVKYNDKYKLYKSAIDRYKDVLVF